MKGDLCPSGSVINESNESNEFEPCSKNLTGLVLLKQSRVDKACSIIDYIQSKLFVSARLIYYLPSSVHDQL